MKKISILFLFFLTQLLQAQDYPTFSKTLKNGLKVIVCEKNDNNFVRVETWYRVGSKDEKAGIRGMAHMFEHMMFRGTKKYPDKMFDSLMAGVGAQHNAYTTFDRTVYFEELPAASLELALDIESDRMANLNVTQEILNTERQVVGEELRNGQNNWYQKLVNERHPLLYPKGHPYAVDIIGYLEEITKFTSQQCMDFYNNYYSPNNAFLVIVGNVKHDNVFALAEKYYEPVTKQLKLELKTTIPGLDTFRIQQTEMPLPLPVQIYSFIFPRPAVSDKDFLPLLTLMELLFTGSNSILNNRLVKKDYSAFGIQMQTEQWNIYPNMGAVDVIMSAQPGNVKVKKAIRSEINTVIETGVPAEMLESYIRSKQSERLLQYYHSSSVAADLGVNEFYYNDFNHSKKVIEEIKKITQEDLKRVAANCFSEDKLQMINIRPE